MTQPENPTGTLRREEVVGLTVGDVMIPRPKTLGPDAHVGEVRALFARRGVRTVLLAEGGAFRGAIDRAGLPESAADDEPASAYADLEPVSARPEMPMSEAIALLESSREPRLVVLDADGVTLRGLICAKPGAATFCVASD
ncbi:MAG TPA: CBS domain-containing protein [Gaiellaceae bacterium]|nr:CBS domain-containing protein [Gaiellaceae bacterium]